MNSFCNSGSSPPLRRPRLANPAGFLLERGHRANQASLRSCGDSRGPGFGRRGTGPHPLGIMRVVGARGLVIRLGGPKGPRPRDEIEKAARTSRRSFRRRTEWLFFAGWVGGRGAPRRPSQTRRDTRGEGPGKISKRKASIHEGNSCAASWVLRGRRQGDRYRRGRPGQIRRAGLRAARNRPQPARRRKPASQGRDLRQRIVGGAGRRRHDIQRARRVQGCRGRGGAQKPAGDRRDLSSGVEGPYAGPALSVARAASSF